MGEPYIKITPLNSVGSMQAKQPGRREVVLLVASDGVVNERFGNHQALATVQSRLQVQWQRWSCRKLSSRPAIDWQACADDLLALTKESNGGDNQSVHLCRLFDRPEIAFASAGPEPPSWHGSRLKNCLRTLRP